MNDGNAGILNNHSVFDNLTHTLLYEGYDLYPYHRSAIKNQKPVPFGVVFPVDYNMHNVHAHSKMQTQCIVTGNDDSPINTTVRFLHLRKTELFEAAASQVNAEPDFVPVNNVNVKGKFYQAGWQTIERTISTGVLSIRQLIKNKEAILIEFDKMYHSEYLYDEGGEAAAKQINRLSEIKGKIVIEVAPVERLENVFRITVTVINLTPVENAERVTRDEVLTQCFLSTHTILQTREAEFISQQSPGEEWKTVISECQNINTWPILLDESNTTLLSSPIILYDYPQINPLSKGDLFDSTEIEEALLLHVALLSDDEKAQIAQSDEKLHAMLDKVSQVTPEELINFHSGLKENIDHQINNEKSGL